MDWLRRNWPDLLIGVALIAVIAGIIATLLSGGSLLSLVRRDAPPETVVTNTPRTAPAGAGGELGTGADATATADTQPGGVDPFIPEVPPPTGDGGAQEAPARTQARREGGARSGSQGAAGAATGVSYRVSAGALDARSSAESLAQSYRDDGLPVSVVRERNLFVVWVGPYDTEAEADRAAGRIIDAGGDALVYTLGAAGSEGAEALTGDAETAGDGNLAAITEELTDTTEPTAEPTDQADPGSPRAGTGAPAAPAGQRYLQAGAFVTLESSQPLREQLQDLGFEVSTGESPNGLVTLLVGPFGDAALERAQARLDAQGIENFPVR